MVAEDTEEVEIEVGGGRSTQLMEGVDTNSKEMLKIYTRNSSSSLCTTSLFWDMGGTLYQVYKYKCM